MVGEGDVGGEQHLHVVGDLVDQRPAVVDDDVAAGAGHDLAGLRTRAHPDLVRRGEAAGQQAGGVGERAGRRRADEQDRGAGRQQGRRLGLAEVLGAEDEDDVAPGPVGDVEAAGTQVGGDGGGGAGQVGGQRHREQGHAGQAGHGGSVEAITDSGRSARHAGATRAS